MSKSPDEQYSDQEARRRVEAALRGAFKTPPKPMKDIPRKRPKAKRNLGKVEAKPTKARKVNP